MLRDSHKSRIIFLVVIILPHPDIKGKHHPSYAWASGDLWTKQDCKDKVTYKRFHGSLSTLLSPFLSTLACKTSVSRNAIIHALEIRVKKRWTQGAQPQEQLRHGIGCSQVVGLHQGNSILIEEKSGRPLGFVIGLSMLHNFSSLLNSLLQSSVLSCLFSMTLSEAVRQ